LSNGRYQYCDELYYKDIYKERNLVERLFQKLKEYRRVDTRYERLAVNYMTMLCLANILIWIKWERP